MAKKLLHILTPLFGILLFAVMLWVLHQALAEKDLRVIAAKEVQKLLTTKEHTPLSRQPHTYLVLALVCTLLAYAVLPLYDWLGLQYIHRRVSRWRVVAVSLLAYVFSNNVGFWTLSGGAVRLRLYTAWGLTAADVVKLVAFTVTGFWMGLLTVAGVMFLLEPLPLPHSPYIPLASVAFVGMAFLVVVAAYVLMCVLWHQALDLGRWKFGLPSLRLALGQLAVGSVDWILCAAPLYALLLASGKELSFPAFFCMFLVAQIVALISHVPGGVGVFEGVMVLMLGPDGILGKAGGIPAEDAFGALIVYRVIYYLLPLVIGAVALAAYELVQRRQMVQPLGQLYTQWAGALVPDILAFVTFIGGVVLLFSGATSPVQQRFNWLSHLVPVSVMQGSLFVGSLAGIGLLLLARGLQQRLDGAYWLAVVLLPVGIVASLLKGWDYEEACILTVFLVALLPCRREFYRHASLFSERFTLTWISGICAVMLGMLWLTLFAEKHPNFMGESWWDFELSATAPHAFQAAVAVSALAMVLVGGQLLRPAPHRHAVPRTADLDQARSVAAQSPSTYAYLALLGDKSLVWDEQRSAFVMYGVSGRSWVAMGDPVGPPEAIGDLAWEFHEQCTSAGGRTVFYQVKPANLHVYVDLGLSFIKLGEEGRVSLDGFSLTGRARKNLRHMLNKAREAGYSFRLASAADTVALMPQLTAISDAWLSAHKLREKGFSLGFFDEDYLAQFPTALVEQSGKIVAFANLWPGASGTELSIDLMRHLPDASNGVMDMLFIELMLWGAAEGYTWFNLGMAPLSGLDDSAMAPFWNRVGAMIYQHGENFYNFQGLRSYKEKFHPIWEPRYLASAGGLALPRILAEVTTLISRGKKGRKDSQAEPSKGDSIVLPA